MRSKNPASGDFEPVDEVAPDGRASEAAALRFVDGAGFVSAVVRHREGDAVTSEWVTPWPPSNEA